MNQDSTPPSRTFVLISTDNRDIVGRYTCGSYGSLACWLERQNEMLCNARVSWLQVSRLAWSGRVVFLDTDSGRSSYLLAFDSWLSYYKQDGRRLVQFEPSVFTYEDHLEVSSQSWFPHERP